MNLHVIILAAGKGTRMKSNTSKVLHNFCGKPLLEHVIKTAQALHPQKIHIVHNKNDSEIIRKVFGDGEINFVEQLEQLGTGHAVMQVLPFIEHSSSVLILYGDVPLIKAATLEKLINGLLQNSINLLTMKFFDASGFGRIVRNSLGEITAIVEHKDANLEQLQIKEANSGIFATTSKVLRNYLPRLNRDNSQKEYYLTDIIEMLVSDKLLVSSLLLENPDEVMGINDRKQLHELERKNQKSIANNLMLQGVSIVDPERFDLRGDLKYGNDVIFDINVVIEGEVAIDSGTKIGPNNFLKNVIIGKNVVIKANCVIEEAVIADNCVIGPFAHIRPGTCLEDGVKIGNFVEVKNTKIGKNSKTNHLSYLGDAAIGSGVNVGAGTITCNYDGTSKHATIIEDNAFIGSNSSLVAPVRVGADATIGAGSVITSNVPSAKLTVARAKQVTIDEWKRKKKNS